MEGLKEVEQDGYLSVLVVTAQPGHKLRALQAGAKDFVSKPFDLAEVLTRVHNMLEVRLFARALERTVQELEASRELVRAKNAELKKLFDQVVAERKVSERLALHVPPDSIAARLKARPDVAADSFADVTVLIADVVGFTELAPAERAERLALMVEEIFSVFDGLAGERGLKKVKTLGQLLHGGLRPAGALGRSCGAGGAPVAGHAPGPGTLHGQRTGSRLQVRIGIATGPVMAGVIGRRQYLFDVWGEAVNTASRMESHGVAGRVQVAESTRRRLGEPFLLEERGVIEIEGQGELKTWFLIGRS